jgi:hypothetical protein
VLYAAATTEKQSDALVLSFRQAVDITLVPMTPGTAALMRRHRSIEDLAPTSFSPECPDELAVRSVGMDFLTWLWFFFEERGGELDLNGHTATVMIEGPLVFYMEGQGAHLAVLRNGEPLVASEAKTSLLGGKKLRRATVRLVLDDEAWSASVDADTFVFRGLKLPKGEALGPVDRFEERMLSLRRFRDVFLSLYDRFLDERMDASRWAETRKAIHGWVAARTAKA